MKAIIIFCLIAASWQLTCDNPLWSIAGNSLAPAEAGRLSESALGPDDLDICTHLRGKDTCCNSTGFDELKANFNTVKANLLEFVNNRTAAIGEI